jgi:hypothetical protein
VDVAEVARDEVGQDLAPAVRQELVAESSAFQEQEHPSGSLAVPDQVLAGPDGAGVAAQALDRVAVLVRHLGEALELADESVGQRPRPSRARPTSTL